MCGFLGRLAYHLVPRFRKLTIKHLTMAYGSEKSTQEIKDLSRDVFIMMGKNGGDIIRAFDVRDLESFRKFTVANGLEHAREAYARGKGIIFLGAHFGAFELMATELSLQGFNPLIIGTPMKDERLTALVWKNRNKFGEQSVARGKDTFRLLKTLKSGGTFGLLIDQDTKVKSVFVDFFGIPCATPAGAAWLAIKTRAAVIPLYFHLRDDGIQELNILPEVELSLTGNEEEDVKVNTQKFTTIFETEIRKYPAQWLWMHERWKTKPGEEII